MRVSGTRSQSTQLSGLFLTTRNISPWSTKRKKTRLQLGLHALTLKGMKSIMGMVVPISCHHYFVCLRGSSWRFWVFWSSVLVLFGGQLALLFFGSLFPQVLSLLGSCSGSLLDCPLGGPLRSAVQWWWGCFLVLVRWWALIAQSGCVQVFGWFSLFGPWIWCPWAFEAKWYACAFSGW